MTAKVEVVALVRVVFPERVVFERVGEVANTRAPLPVSSVTIPASSEEVSISVLRIRFTPPARVSSSPIVSSSFERRTALSRKLPEIEVVAITEPDALVERRDEVRPVMAKVEVVALVCPTSRLVGDDTCEL